MITYIVGLAGSGKTTHASHLIYKAHKKGLNTYSNVPIFNAYVFDPLEDLMVYNVSNGIIIIDEAAIDFNSRKYKTLSDNVNEFVRKHRHANTNIYVYSQNFMGADKLFRDNAEKVVLLRRSRVPHHAFVRVYNHDIIPPDKDNPEFRDVYRLNILATRLMRYGGKYSKMFNSFEMPLLQEKTWIMWQDTDMFSPTPKRCNRFAQRWAIRKTRRAPKNPTMRLINLRGAISTIRGKISARLKAAAVRFLPKRKTIKQSEKTNISATIYDINENIGTANKKTEKQETETNQTKEKTPQTTLQGGASASPAII